MDQKGYLPYPKGFATTAIHTGHEPENWDSMAVVPPIVLSTTFKRTDEADFKAYEYGRTGNPTRNTLEGCMAAIESAKHAICFSSGLAAINAVLGILEQGDHVISAVDIYGGTYRLFNEAAPTNGLQCSFIDTTNVKNIEAAITPKTKLIWLESPTNPLLKVNDIKAVCEIAKKHKIIVAVDNTFLTSYLQRPLDFGADLSVYSLTKYVNGHSDVIMGAIVTNNDELHKRIRFLQNAAGAIPAPFDCALVTRSLKTLPLRMRQHSANAIAIAQFLEKHPKVVKVLQPGLPNHPHHELSKKQTSDHCGMVSFYLKGELVQAKKFLASLKFFMAAGSLGGHGSLAELPVLISHAQIPPEQRKSLNITDNLVRLSVGLEDVDDLIADLNQAFEKI